MTGNSFLSVHLGIENERRAKFCGTASIKVASLKLRESVAEEKFNKKGVETLERIFREEHGSRQEESNHHAKALISTADLQAAALMSQISIESLMADTLPYPKLDLLPGVKLECLQGCDRVSAAEKVLGGSDKRWVVDLFADDLSDNLKRMLIEDWDYQKDLEDGELYCKIREFQGIHGEKNVFFERVMIGRLATKKYRLRNFQQLSSHREFAAAFDKLLDIPGLFGGLRLSVVHQVISMRCDEPHLHYLKHIWTWWSGICDGDMSIMRQICRRTVEELQGKAPGASKTDYQALHIKFRSRLIFGNFLDEKQREELWFNTCSASKQCLIPSLFTFFEDQKFLSCVAGCFKHIIDIGSKETIAGRLEDIFTDVNQRSDRCLVQISEHEYGSILGDAATRLSLGSHHMWLAACREYIELPPDTTKKELLAKPRTKANEAAKFRFACLASRVGFESAKISNILKTHPDREIAANALSSARKPGQFRYANIEECIRQIVDIFETASLISKEDIPEASEYSLVQPPNRFGLPHDLDHERDKTSLFFPSMDELDEVDQTSVTSLFVRKSVYRAYFGWPSSMSGLIRNHDDADTDGDVFMTNQGELNMLMIRGKPDLEQAQGSSSQAPRQIQQLMRGEQVVLTKLKDLTEEEQKKLDKLTAETQKLMESLAQLENREKQARQDLANVESKQEELNEVQRALNKLKELSKSERKELDKLTAEVQTRIEGLAQLENREKKAQQELADLENKKKQVKEDIDQQMQKMRDEVKAQNENVAVLSRELEATRSNRDSEPGTLAAPQQNESTLQRGQRKSQKRKRTTEFNFSRMARPRNTLQQDSDEIIMEETGEELTRTAPLEVHIQFEMWSEDGRDVIVLDEMDVDLSDPQKVGQVEETAKHYLRAGMWLFDVAGNYLTAKDCFQKVMKSPHKVIRVQNGEEEL